MHLLMAFDENLHIHVFKTEQERARQMKRFGLFLTEEEAKTFQASKAVDKPKKAEKHGVRSRKKSNKSNDTRCVSVSGEASATSA